MRKSYYVSCNCDQCKNASSKIKKEHKKRAHRALRRKEKLAIKNDEPLPQVVSSGYKS